VIDVAKLLAKWRRHNAERSAKGYWREYRERPGVQARRAENNRAYRARRKARLEELFA